MARKSCLYFRIEKDVFIYHYFFTYTHFEVVDTIFKSEKMTKLFRPKIKNKMCFRTQGYKTFFMLNSAEHIIFSANKYENANNSWHFGIYQQRNFHAQLCLARKNLKLLVI